MLLKISLANQVSLRSPLYVAPFRIKYVSEPIEELTCRLYSCAGWGEGDTSTWNIVRSYQGGAHAREPSYFLHIISQTNGCAEIIGRILQLVRVRK